MKYMSDDKQIFDTKEDCLVYESTLKLKEYCKLYKDSFDEITDYRELGFSALAYIKIIDADKFVKELAKIEDNVDDTGLYLDDLFNLADSFYDLIDGHIYSQNYNGDWFDIALAEERINKRKNKYIVNFTYDYDDDEIPIVRTAKTLEDAYQFLYELYQVKNPEINFYEKYPFDKVKSEIEENGYFDFMDEDDIETIEFYINDYLTEV